MIETAGERQNIRIEGARQRGSLYKVIVKAAMKRLEDGEDLGPEPMKREYTIRQVILVSPNGTGEQITVQYVTTDCSSNGSTERIVIDSRWAPKLGIRESFYTAFEPSITHLSDSEAAGVGFMGCGYTCDEAYGKLIEALCLWKNETV